MERVMTEKGCDNCYYSYFDERAYPCSLCIRGIERTDMWQPSKKAKTESQTEVKVEPTWEGVTYGRFEAEPQTEMEKSGSRAVQTARCLNCHNAKACKENHWEVCRYEPWKLTAVEDEPQTERSE